MKSEADPRYIDFFTTPVSPRTSARVFHLCIQNPHLTIVPSGGRSGEELKAE